MTPTGPTPPAVPPAPPGDYYDATQWAVLTSLLDAVIPSIAPASKVTDEKTHRGIDDAEYEKLASLVEAKVNPAPSPEALKAYLDDRPSANPGFMNGLLQALGNLPQSARARLGGVLSALGTRYGSLLLTGSTVPVHEQSLADREAVLQRWSSSWFGTPRVLYKTFTSLAKVTWLQTAVYAEAAGFPAVPTNWKPVESAFEFDFLQFSATTSDDEPAVVETDVVIVGSGCGGGVAAKVLAEAGHRVLVVDKGYYFPPSQLPMTADGGAFHLLENNGLISSVDSSVNVVGGSCWGGGGTVNWSVSLHTQGFVRKEWAEEHGLPFFESAEYQDCLDRVCDFMGVIRGDQVRQTHRGKMLLEGSRRLGWPAEVCPQNTGGKEHWCGHCHLGCGAGEKQGPAVSWLPHAARNGAKFAEGFAVDHILWDETDTSGDKVATGIRGTWTSRDSSGATIGSDRTTRQVIVKAKKVIVSAGTLNSPLVLMKSGLTNPHIGSNLYLHPVNFVLGVFDEDIRPWEGGIITSVCTNFENLDGNGHGVKLESTCMLPYAILTHFPWRNGLDFKLNALRLRHTAGYISLARDRDTGRIYPDPRTGKPLLDYRVSPFDAAHVLEGVIGLAKICYVAGASEIHPMLPGVEPFVRDRTTEVEGAGVTDPAFVAWLGRLRAVGNAPPYAPFVSAHQMGTCRMSSHAGAGVVDSRGRVWGTRGVYVADASVFPSASGVNPMVTTMGIADWIARGVAKELA